MLDLQDARQQILTQLRPRSGCETVDLSAALHRVLAEDIHSPVDVPPADNSAMDGYALHTDSLASGQRAFALSQRIAAGQAPKALAAQTLARIFTGGEIPAAANAVVMQEHCEHQGDHVLLKHLPKPGDNIRRQGQDIRQGNCILSAGEKLRAPAIGLLASVGLDRVAVRQPLKVALLSTGDELIDPGQPLAAGQIYNANMPMLRAALTTAGCQVVRTQQVKDDLDSTRAALQASAAVSDLVLSTGGVSVGEEDHVKAAVQQLGRLNLWKVRIKPGKPLAFGHLDQTPFIGLPGNPVSSFVTFCLLVIPAIRTLMAQHQRAEAGIYLPANFTMNKAQSRPEFIRARIVNGQVEKFPNQSSGVLSSLCWADALALVPAQTPVQPGDPLEVFSLDALLS